MAAYKGEAVHDAEPTVFNKKEDYPGFNKPESTFAGGMSAAEARMVNHRGRFPYGTGNQGPVTMGTSTSRDATNTIEKPGPNPTEASPAATRQSRDR